MTRNAIESILSFEAPPLLMKRFCKEENVSEKEALKRFEETKKFLYVCGMDRQACYCPSRPVDTMWHAFMLHSRSYFRFCELVGGYVHHEPSDGLDRTRYFNTLQSLERIFGKCDSSYWAEMGADCEGNGPCSDCGV